MTNRTRAILLSAVMACAITPGALGQYRQNTGGANDANNRIGSGGSNEGGRSFNQNLSNSIVTGNVTAGREFRGPSVGDPRAFRGSTGGSISDNFVRQSSSAYTNNAQQVRQYYGDSFGTPPPSGFQQQQLGSTGYVPAPPAMRSGGDLRLGDVGVGMTQLARPGELMVPGPVDASNAQSLLTASPLYGIRKDNAADLSDDGSFVSQYTNIRRPTPLNSRAGADDATIQQMRDELNRDVISDNPNDQPQNQKPDERNLGAGAAIRAPHESPETQGLAGKPLNSGLTSTALPGDVSADQGTRSELVPPMQQSTQYAELRRRFGNLQNKPQTDQDRNVEFQKQFNQRQRDLQNRDRASGVSSRRAGFGNWIPSGNTGAAPVPPANGNPTPPVTDANPPTPEIKPDEIAVKPPVEQKTPEVVKPETVKPDGQPKTPVKPPTDNSQAPSLATDSVKPGEALKVTTLTDGMKPGRVRDMLATAEEQMRGGKYQSALDQYDLAERVVPNNPLITLGRAHAELGGTYYARAEDNIRRALDADNALMIAQFDLQAVLGKERLTFLEKDLKDITQTEPKSTRAPFLLAYLKYHTGDKKMAANYLALSEKRRGNEDALYRQLRFYWNLPKADPIPDGDNK